MGCAYRQGIILKQAADTSTVTAIHLTIPTVDLAWARHPSAVRPAAAARKAPSNGERQQVSGSTPLYCPFGILRIIHSPAEDSAGVNVRDAPPVTSSWALSGLSFDNSTSD